MLFHTPRKAPFVGQRSSRTLGFQIGDSGLKIGYFDDDGTLLENQIYVEPESTLAAGDNAQFSVVVLDSNNKRVTTAEEVGFTSGCISAGLATVNLAIAQSVNGQASSQYTATGCSGTDQITASLTGTSAQAFGTLTIASQETNAVNYVSPDPLLIVMKGTGGQNRDETSDVVFEVVDGTGAPLPGVNVKFALTTYVGGLSLSKMSSLSNGDGRVIVTVRAGDVAEVVRVLATVDDGNGNPVTAVSDLLTVTTGLPDQDSISLAVGDCGGEGSFVVDGGFTIGGLCRTLTVSMSDKFNNPVVNGAAAVFTTEYGCIQSTCTTVNGSCRVERRSGEPRVPTLTGFQYVVDNDSCVNCPSHGGDLIPCAQD